GWAARCKLPSTLKTGIQDLRDLLVICGPTGHSFAHAIVVPVGRPRNVLRRGPSTDDAGRRPGSPPTDPPSSVRLDLELRLARAQPLLSQAVVRRGNGALRLVTD